MKMPNRDLLVLMKDEGLDKEAMEHELAQLNQLLVYFETMDNFCTAHEVFDLNRYKIIRQADRIQKIINEPELRSFVFICNKN